MAKKVESFKFPGQGHNIYPWDEWCDGDVWKAQKGTDFQNGARSFTGSLRSQARRTGKKVHTSIDGDIVVFQFYDLE